MGFSNLGGADGEEVARVGKIHEAPRGGRVLGSVCVFIAGRKMQAGGIAGINPRPILPNRVQGFLSLLKRLGVVF